ncbi:hypothetical protein MRX96_028746 [Rhipicephalus microplus]
MSAESDEHAQLLRRTTAAPCAMRASRLQLRGVPHLLEHNFAAVSADVPPSVRNIGGMHSGSLIRGVAGKATDMGSVHGSQRSLTFKDAGPERCF